MVRPELGTKRLCPNCGAKYYDLNRDPIICPKCNASFATGIVAMSAREADDEDEDETDEEGIELVDLEEADGDSSSDDVDGEEDDGVQVDSDDDALIDEDDDESDEVSDVVRGGDEGVDDER